jgi:hypothetical protein
VTGSVNNSSPFVENDPSGDSNSLTRVESSRGTTLTQRGIGHRTNERLPFTVSIGLSVTVNISSPFGLIPKDSRRGGGGESVDLKLTLESEGFKLNSILGSIIDSTQRKSFTGTGDGILEGKLERSRLGEGTNVSAMEPVLTWRSKNDTEVEAVTSTPSFSNHGRLMDSERIIGEMSSGTITSSSLFSLTDDHSLSSIRGDSVRKSPSKLDSVNIESRLGCGGTSIISSNNTCELTVTKGTSFVISSNKTEVRGVNTNTEKDLSSIIGVFTERYDSRGISVSLSRWLGDGKESSELSSSSMNVVGSWVGEVSIDGGTSTNQVGWHLDRDLELHLESRVIGRSKILSHGDGENVTLGSTLGSGNLQGGRTDIVGGVSIINTELSVSTGGDPSPWIVSHRVFDPSRSGSNLSSVSGSTKGHNDVERSLDNSSGSPSGHSESPLDLSSLSWELFSGSSRSSNLGLSKSKGRSSSINVDGVEDSVDVHDGTSSSEVVHSSLNSDWSERTSDSTGTRHSKTVGSTGGQSRGEGTLEKWCRPSTGTQVGWGGWWGKAGGQCPNMDDRWGCNGWHVSRRQSYIHVSTSGEGTIQSKEDGKSGGSALLRTVPSRLCYTVDSTRHSNANDGSK